MAFSSQDFGDGQVALTKTTLFTVAPAKQAAGLELRFFSTHSASVTVIVYLDLTGTSRKQHQFVLGPNESALWTIKGLAAGDIVEAEASVAAVIDWTAVGAESDI
jgi:hypothetical protein